MFKLVGPVDFTSSTGFLRLGVHKGREGNGMEWNDHKGMERNGMEWNVFKQEKGMEKNGM